MKFIKDFLNSGTAKQQKRKRLGALLVSITAALLVVALLVLAVFGIVGAIKNRGEEEETEEEGNKIPKGYVTTEFSKDQDINGTLLKITESKANSYKGKDPKVKPSPEVRKAAGVEGLYFADYGDTDTLLQQETMDAFHAMVKAFYAAEGDTLKASAKKLYLDSNSNPKSAKPSEVTKAVMKSGMVLIISEQEIDRQQNRTHAEAKEYKVGVDDSDVSEIGVEQSHGRP